MSLPSAGIYLKQNVKEFAALLGQSVTFSASVKTSGATAGLFIYDGTTATYSSLHSGSGSFETLSVTATIPLTANQVVVGIGYPQVVDFANPVWMGASTLYVQAQEAVVSAGCRYCGTFNPRGKGRSDGAFESGVDLSNK